MRGRIAAALVGFLLVAMALGIGAATGETDETSATDWPSCEKGESVSIVTAEIGLDPAGGPSTPEDAIRTSWATTDTQVASDLDAGLVSRMPGSTDTSATFEDIAPSGIQAIVFLEFHGDSWYVAGLVSCASTVLPAEVGA